MRLYQAAKDIIKSTTGVEFYRGNPPWGTRWEKDLPRLMPGFSPRIILDVGANVGQTADRILAAFPRTTLHCFEPVGTTYAKLRQHLQSSSNVYCHQLALSDHTGTAQISLFEASVIASLEQPARPPRAFETVSLQTLDAFVAERSLGRIDLLKVDTEGHDLSVLAGGKALLAAQQVSFILTEVQLSTLYPGKYAGPRLNPVSTVMNRLEPFGYRCVGLYDQEFTPAWGLHFGNALFASTQLLP